MKHVHNMKNILSTLAINLSIGLFTNAILDFALNIHIPPTKSSATSRILYIDVNEVYRNTDCCYRSKLLLETTTDISCHGVEFSLNQDLPPTEKTKLYLN